MKTTLLSVLILFCSLNIFSQEKIRVDVGEKAFDFVGIDENGNKIKISDFKGIYILLNFTGTACPPFWGTYDHMNTAQEKYKDEPHTQNH